MNCSEFQYRCEQALEAHGPTSTEQAALAEHVAACHQQHCRGLWQEMELLAEAVRVWRENVAEVDLTDGVLARLRQEARVPSSLPTAPPLTARYALVRDPSPDQAAAPSSSGDLSWISLLMLTAALLLVASMLSLTVPTAQDVASSPPSPTEQVVVVGRSPQRVAPSPPVVQPPGKRLGGAYASMSVSAAQFLTDAVVLVVPADQSDPDEEPSPTDAWAERLEERWEPIGRELNRSLEVLIDAVPHSESAS